MLAIVLLLLPELVYNQGVGMVPLLIVSVKDMTLAVAAHVIGFNFLSTLHT